MAAARVACVAAEVMEVGALVDWVARMVAASEGERGEAPSAVAVVAARGRAVAEAEEG